jgi:hypothetical protein
MARAWQAVAADQGVAPGIALPALVEVGLPTLPAPRPAAAAAPPDGSGHGQVALVEATVSAPLDGQATIGTPRGPVGDSSLVARRPASRADSVLADIALPQFAGLSSAPLSQWLATEELQRKFDEIQRQLDAGESSRRGILASGAALSGGLSIGYVVWLVRGGVLASSMLSALPAWQMIDPLPVLAAARRRGRPAGGERDEPDVERLFDDSGSRAGDAPTADRVRTSATPAQGTPEAAEHSQEHPT